MRLSHRSHGFTLIELMISVAFALVLMLGVNQVFQATADTIGVGQSFIKANADARTVEATINSDMAGIDPVYTLATPVGDAPCMIIMSQHQYAFRDNVDYQRATDQTKPYSDSNLFGNSSLFPNSNQCPVPFLHFRSHRVDRFGFFQRGVYARQTSSTDAAYISSTTSSEAWTFWCHSVQPNNAAIAGAATGAAWLAPGAPATSSIKNDNNFFTSDWLLARQLMLLLPNPTDPTYYPVSAVAESPLASNTQSVVSAQIGLGSAQYTVDSSRLDLAKTSIYNFNRILSGFATTAWWGPLINYRLQASAVLISDPTVTAGATTPKITPYALAKSSPALIRGCSHFIVEYSGNFYTKDANGAFAAAAPDPTGINDFYVDQTTKIRHTRWYGYPRAVNSINSYTTGTPNINSDNGDVVPLRDTVIPAGATGPVVCDAERFTGASTDIPGSIGNGPNYWTAMSPSTDFTSPYTYIAAWGPTATGLTTNQPFPKMIRIVIGVDDRDGHLKNSQLYEYVFDVLP